MLPKNALTMSEVASVIKSLLLVASGDLDLLLEDWLYSSRGGGQ
jgi:hypothetical protein